MKMRYIFTIVACLVSLHLIAQTPVKPLSISKLTGDFYIYTTYQNEFPSNSMYVVTDSGVVMLDTPWDTTQMQPLLDSIQMRHHKKVLLCISTHFHADRTAGLEFLKRKGIKTFSSKLTFDLCAINNDKQAAYYFIYDTTFIAGDHVFQTYFPGEGHTKDNIVIWFDKEKILYGGCLIKSIDTEDLGNIADANIPAWPETIKNIMRKFPPPNYVIPGHFGWQSNEALEHTLQLMEHAADSKR
ncbi:MAG: BlaB/IND/MUS family subclass B1 metallo-beta-lactamase [Ginsengibacter sp.]